jgi:hypothetical protein
MMFIERKGLNLPESYRQLLQQDSSMESSFNQHSSAKKQLVNSGEKF